MCQAWSIMGTIKLKAQTILKCVKSTEIETLLWANTSLSITPPHLPLSLSLNLNIARGKMFQTIIDFDFFFNFFFLFMLFCLFVFLVPGDAELGWQFPLVKLIRKIKNQVLCSTTCNFLSFIPKFVFHCIQRLNFSFSKYDIVYHF